MTPEERRKIYPPYIVSETEKKDPPNYLLTKISDFLPLIRAIWKISNKSYQENFWRNRREYDSYNGTTETFLEDAEAVLDTSDYTVEMTPKQREMLKKLYDMIEDYECNPNAVEDLNCDYTDGKIIEDPEFAKCRDYARLVYEELSGDDLDAWEKSREIES